MRLCYTRPGAFSDPVVLLMKTLRTAATALLPAVTVGLLTVLGLACSRTPPGSVDDLFVTNKRFNIDNEAGVVRVYARVENTGKGIVREAKMEATLRSADGSKRGANNVILKDIAPGEKRDFSIIVTSHSQAADVDILAREVEK